jgi:hypothetical protein
MEPRKEELKKTPQQRPDERKRRFQMVKLEERIAPCGHYNPHDKVVGHGGICGGG